MLNVQYIVDKMQYISPRLAHRIFNSCLNPIIKRDCSFLFVTGDKKSGELYSAVEPHLDFDERFKNLQCLEENVSRRELKIDVRELSKSWEFYKERLLVKEELLAKKKEVVSEMQKIYSLEDKTKELESLKFELQIAKDTLKKATSTLWDIEKNVVIQALQLPNAIDCRVSDEEKVERFFGSEIQQGDDHLKAGEKNNYLTYINPSCYYLKNDLAKLEISIVNYFETQFKNRNHFPVSNPDFAKPVLVEGCVLKTESDLAFTLSHHSEIEKLYLSGGASFLSFYGLHAKHVVELDSPSFRYVAKGRQYRSNVNPHLKGLYSVWQATSVDFFIGCSNSGEASNEFDSALDFLIELYESLGLNFRLVNQPAKRLHPWECARFTFELFSSTAQTYAEVGSVSIINDFISKRLQAHCIDERNNLNFLHVVTGTALRVPVLLATILETSDIQSSVENLLRITTCSTNAEYLNK